MMENIRTKKTNLWLQKIVTKPTATRGRPPKKAKPEGLVDMAGKEESSTTEVYHSNNVHDCISKMDVIDLSEVSPVNRLVFFQSLADAGYLRSNGRELMGGGFESTFLGENYLNQPCKPFGSC